MQKMDADAECSVTITHFINPHLFWFRKDESPRNESIQSLVHFERKLEDMYRNTSSRYTQRYRPDIGDKVAVNYMAWNKFIRAEVLQIAEFSQQEYIVWTTDYGFPLVTKKEHIYKLPNALELPVKQIYRGGVVNIEPAEVDYDHIECNLIMSKQENWLQKACNMLEYILADAANIIFMEKFKTKEKHIFGDLIVISHKGNSINASTYLQTAKYALEVGPAEFQGHVLKLKSTKIAPWLTNNRKTNMKYNTLNAINSYPNHKYSAIMDERVKRKVDDWCARNDRQKEVNVLHACFESGVDNYSDQAIDDITFDDSVSVVHRKNIEEENRKSSTDLECFDINEAEQKQVREKNYIGKAGALKKFKQRKHLINENYPQEAILHAFDIEDTFWSPPSTAEMPLNKSKTTSTASMSTRLKNLSELRAKFSKSGTSSQLREIPINVSNTNCSGSLVSKNLQKLAEIRKKASNASNTSICSDNVVSENLQMLTESRKKALNASSTTISSCSVVSKDMQRMFDIRRKYAQKEKEERAKEAKSNISEYPNPLSGPTFKPKEEQNVCTAADLNNSIITAPGSTCNSKISARSQKMIHNEKDVIPSVVVDVTPQESIKPQAIEQNYDISVQLPNQSLNMSEINPEKTEVNKSNILTKAERLKRLNALRDTTKQQPKALAHCDSIAATSELKSTDSTSAITKNIEDLWLQDVKKPNVKLAKLSFNLIPKKDTQEEVSSLDGLTLVPAGFDIARLQNYRDENNHWHRKKTTRHDHVPHSLRHRSELFHSAHDQSSSVSEFFHVKPPAVKQKHSKVLKGLPIKSITTDSRQEVSDDCKTSDLSMPALKSNPAHSTKWSSESCSGGIFSGTTTNKIPTRSTLLPPSTTSTTTSKNRNNSMRKQREQQQECPTAQLSKIDEILSKHRLESELDNSSQAMDFSQLIRSHKNPPPPLEKEKAGGTTVLNTKITSPDESLLKESYKSGNEMVVKSSDECYNKKHLKNLSNYSTLMEVKQADYFPIVAGEMSMKTKFIDHLVLAHSCVPFMPIRNISEATFLPEIHQEMRNMRINKVYRIQVYSWTHLLRGNSLFIINPARTGKTWSYLPAVCSMVCYQSTKFKPSYGPIALILMSSSRHVESITAYTRRLMSGFRADAPSCVPLYGIRNHIESKVNLLNGCGILITTPSSLVRLMKDGEREPLIDWNRLLHIVIDDMDLILARSHTDFESALRTVLRMTKLSPHKTLPSQLIVTSRDWDSKIVHLLRKSNQPMLLVGDFLEAAVYGRAILNVKLTAKEDKNKTIHRFFQKHPHSLQGNLSQERSIIICSTDDDVDTILEYLTEFGYSCLAFCNRSTVNEKETVDEWKIKLSSQILICTDARFYELEIQNVNILIHYSLPTSWTKFTLRFSAVAQMYENFVVSGFAESLALIDAPRKQQYKSLPYSMILLDEENSLQLPRLVHFMNKHHQSVDPDILAVSKRVLVTREEMRIADGTLLCPQLLEFGECDEDRCENRHVLTCYDIIDDTEDIPSKGDVRLHILKVYSPTHFAARLMYHRGPNEKSWNEIRRSQEALPFAMQLDMQYHNEANLALHWPPKPKDLCIYRYGDRFKRALILYAPSLEGKSTNVVVSKLKVKIKLIDEGTILSDINCSEIFICAEEYKNFPAQAVDIRLMDVVPFDNERTWDSKTMKIVKKWIVDDIKPNQTIQAGISFSLANTVWVKNVAVYEELEALGTYRQIINLKRTLIGKNYACLYNGDRKHVRQIAEQFGLLSISDTTTVDEHVVDSAMIESCPNEGVDLKCSSSNFNDSDSLKNYSPRSPNPKMNGEKSKDVNQELKKMSDIEEEEDWDVLHYDGNRAHSEVYVPLKNDKQKTADGSLSLASANCGQPKREESWTQLLLNDLTKVEIGDEGENGNWENIFMQVIDKKHMQLFDELVELINQHVNRIKANKDQQEHVYDFAPLHNCIVKYNGTYLRAKVHGVFGSNTNARLYRFFLCDYACFTNIKSSDLYNDCFYETTDEILQYTPYQSVHCTLAGIQWDRFTKRYQVTKEYIYACAMEGRNDNEKNALTLYNLPIRSYKILLFECENDGEYSTAELFNKKLIDESITTCDETTKHFLDYKLDIDKPAEKKVVEYKTIDIEEVTSCCPSNEDEVLSFDQLVKFMQKSAELDYIENTLFEETTDLLKDIKVPGMEDGSAAKEKVSQDEKENDEKQLLCYNYNNKRSISLTEIDTDNDEDHCTTDTDNKMSSVSLSSSVSSGNTSDEDEDKNEVLLPLRVLHKAPITTWYDTDCVIFLSIYAPDVKDYYLKVEPKTLLFTTRYEDEDYVLHLHLLAAVQPEHVSHEMRGLNVVIRLVKNVYIQWPRLLEDPTKYAWLKYNYSCFDFSGFECIAPQQILQTVFETSPHMYIDSNLREDFDSDDSECDKFVTHNRIENKEDCYDPFA